MRADLRPYWVKKAWLNCREAWINYFLKPRCASLGPCPNIMNPWWVDVSGNNIHIGHSFTAVGEASQRIKIGVWGREQGSGCIRIGDAVLLSPGVRIACSDEITMLFATVVSFTAEKKSARSAARAMMPHRERQTSAHRSRPPWR